MRCEHQLCPVCLGDIAHFNVVAHYDWRTSEVTCHFFLCVFPPGPIVWSLMDDCAFGPSSVVTLVEGQSNNTMFGKSFAFARQHHENDTFIIHLFTHFIRELFVFVLRMCSSSGLAACTTEYTLCFKHSCDVWLRSSAKTVRQSAVQACISSLHSRSKSSGTTHFLVILVTVRQPLAD